MRTRKHENLMERGKIMAIADVTIIPIGTETPSVSAYVADVQRILEGFQQEGKSNFN